MTEAVAVGDCGCDSEFDCDCAGDCDCDDSCCDIGCDCDGGCECDCDGGCGCDCGYDKAMSERIRSINLESRRTGVFRYSSNNSLLNAW